MNPERLELSAEEMLELGHRVVDLIVEHLTGLRKRPFAPPPSPAEARELVGGPLPDRPGDPLAALESAGQVLSATLPLDHPRFFAFVPGPGNFVGAMADALASGFNVFAATWLEAAGPAQVERETLEWLRETCRMPEGAGGLFVSGGSMANLTALALAGHRKPAGSVLYCSDQTHSSVDRAARVLGLELRRLPSDHDFRLPTATVAEALAGDRRQGAVALGVVANAGTTNTGAVDPLGELAALCASEELWLHVDGAYGAAAMLTERGRARLAGIEQTDSLALDPHKWLFQPYEIGCLLVREEEWLTDAFRVLPEYLVDVAGEGVNFCDRGLQLTRGFRALKLWLSLRVFGREAFGTAVDRGLDLAEHAEAVLRASPGWEVTSPATLGIVTFRHRTAGSQDLATRLLEDGFAMLSTTELRGRRVLRMCTINPRTTDEDVEATIARLEELAG